MTQDRLPNGATLIGFDDAAQGGRVFAWAQNFIVEWLRGEGSRIDIESADEMILLLPEGHAVLKGDRGDAVLAGPVLAITPPGRYSLSLETAGPLVVLGTDRPDLNAAQALNAPAGRDERIAPVGEPFVRAPLLSDVRIMPIADIPTPPSNKRIRFVQSATMSINFVLYDGPRGASALSPHAHADIEQGTLALEGQYVHHLRTPWGPDATAWQDDAHLAAAPASLLLIPPELVHTTEGIGEGRHLLVDIFAPPRRDFIARAWIANAADYVDPMGARREGHA